MNIRRPIIAAVALAFAPGAIAHPHVWIEMATAVGFTEKGEVAALGISWTFDEFFSIAAVDGLDKDKDGKYSPAELQELVTTYLANLQKYQYFTSIEANGKRVAPGLASNGAAAMNGGRLTIRFRLPLSAPVDPRKTQFSYSSFDPSYYIDIRPAKVGGVTFGANAPPNCGFSIRQSDSVAPPMALNIPESLKQPAPPDGVFGMLPAAIVDIRCK